MAASCDWCLEARRNGSSGRCQFATPAPCETLGRSYDWEAEGSGMAWLLLIVAGMLETGWAVALKTSDGLSKLVPSVVFLVLGIASVLLLAVALRSLPVGTAYAVWTGIGAAGTAIVGLGEPAQTVRLLSIGLIVAGVVGLNLAGSH